MAYIDYDNSEDPFVNVSHRVGAKGDWDDLYVVQLMLEFIYIYDSTLKDTKPTKGPVTVSGKPAADTPILIAHYQKTFMKRSHPQGYIDRAVRKDNLFNSTIYRLYRHMDILLGSLGFVTTSNFNNVISYMKKRVPLLAPRLKTGPEKAAPQPVVHPSVYP